MNRADAIAPPYRDPLAEARALATHEGRGVLDLVTVMAGHGAPVIVEGPFRGAGDVDWFVRLGWPQSGLDGIWRWNDAVSVGAVDGEAMPSRAKPDLVVLSKIQGERSTNVPVDFPDIWEMLWEGVLNVIVPTVIGGYILWKVTNAD